MEPDGSAQVAVFVDFENLVLGAVKELPDQANPAPYEALTRLCRGYGNASVRRAYADWAHPRFGGHQEDLAMNGVDLIQVARVGMDYKLFVLQIACATNCLYYGYVQQLIGRDRELADLHSAWQRAQSGAPQLAVVWGRRRVGKTFMLTHFAEGKRTVYFTATRQDSAERQLFRLTERIREQLGGAVDDLLAGPFRDWEAALRFLVRLAETEPLLVVIDEAPRLLSSQHDFADLVSAVWENQMRGQRLMLVLTGSAVSVMEQMLGAQGGLHRRAALECRLDPFSAPAARSFLPSIPAADFITAYSVCGGYPLHLDQWEESRSVEDNLRRHAYEPAGILVRDAMASSARIWTGAEGTNGC